MKMIMKAAKSNRRWFVVRCAAVLLAVVLWTPSCSESRPQSRDVGSETNFLNRCETDVTCGRGLSCLCGTCTQTCDAIAACEALSSAAACVPVASRPTDPTCPESAVSAFCDQPCAEDAACAGLGSAYRCVRGFCRALSSSCETGVTAGSNVILLGDSFIATSHEFTRYLEQQARASGALGPDESYRDYSTVTRCNLAAQPPGISAQYAKAQQEGAAKVVIMDGGGADVLMGTCPEPIGPDCQLVQDAVAGADVLFQSMVEGGVEHVVFFFYPDYVGDDTIKATVDVLRPLLEERCASAPLPCDWFDLRPTYVGHYDEYVLPLGRNPTTAGALASAQAIWDFMQQRCVAQ
jgi:hypothetical protein